MGEVNEETRELRGIIRSLTAYLEWQRELGVEGFPLQPVKEKAPLSESGETLDEIGAQLGDCTRCRLGQSRNKIVFGAGNSNAELLFIGEAPGAEEDRKGQPFVGRAGALLDGIIKAMGFERREVYITNVLKCRPPSNRDPRPDEIELCMPFLLRQVRAISPKAIVTLGRFAARTLLDVGETPISALRGRFHSFEDIPLMPTYHPSFLLHKQGTEQTHFKRCVWEDVQQVSKLLGRKTRGKSR